MNEHVRADARRNRSAIVAAARAAVAESGIEVSLDQIARRAKVNARTLFRHFSSKEELLAAVLEDYFAERVEPFLRRAAEDPDPRRALATVLGECTAAFVEHPKMFELVGGTRTAEITSRHLQPVSEVLSRARLAGVVRDDLTPDDFPCLVTMLVASACHAGQSWHRYLALVLDSLSPAAASAPLPAAAQRQ